MNLTITKVWLITNRVVLQKEKNTLVTTKQIVTIFEQSVFGEETPEMRQVESKGALEKYTLVSFKAFFLLSF